MNMAGPYEFAIQRSFENPQWVPTKSCIDYTQ